MPAIVKRVTDLQLEGPTIEVIVWPPGPVINEYTSKGLSIPNFKLIGLIDTGASMTGIDKSIAQKLNLISRDCISILTPSGESDMFTYDAGIMLPVQLGHKMFFIEVLGSDLEKQPFDVLIGRDILESCTLIFNGWDHSFSLHI